MYISKYYTLDTAAKKLSISVDYLLQIAENGGITLSFRIKRAGKVFFDYKELIKQNGESFLSTVVPNYTSHEYMFGAYITLTTKQVTEIAVRKYLIAADAIKAPEKDLYISAESYTYHAYKINLDDIVIHKTSFKNFQTSLQN